MIKLSLPEEVNLIINTLKKNGHRADVVGGAVRDAYISRETSDYDITTDALPEEIKRVFSGVRTIDTGIKHGTVTLHIGGENYEVTTYRRDGDYLDARHPTSVEFTSSLAEDVLRRDFTMNALCYNEEDGLTDFVGGISDIENRLIRTVGDPVTRFSEDALRILRAVRFSAVLGFEVEEKTAAAVHGCRDLLLGISRERVYAEWQKLISGDDSYSVLEKFSDVISTFLPLPHFALPSADRFASADGFTRTLALFALGTDSAPAAYDEAMTALKTDRASRELGKAALICMSAGVPRSRSEMLRTLAKYGEDAVRAAVKTAHLIGKCRKDAEKVVDGAIASGVPYKLKDLKIRGNDLIEAGLSGEKIGCELERLLLLVIDGKCENEREALIREISI